MNLFWLIRALLSFRARACENIPRIPQDVATPETRDFLLSRAGLPKVGKGHNRQSSELWITDVKKKTPTSSFLVWGRWCAVDFCWRSKRWKGIFKEMCVAFWHPETLRCFFVKIQGGWRVEFCTPWNVFVSVRLMKMFSDSLELKWLS